MKKFVFLFTGTWTPSDEMKKAWGQWFASVADKFVDSGNPFGPGIEITHDGTKQLPMDKESITGYSIINAASLDEAEKIAQTCPIVTGVKVYEAMSM